MIFKNITQKMTKEEFFEKEVGHCGCPDKFNFKNEYIENCSNVTCEECWLKAIEKNNIKFKDDEPEEQKVIDALEIVQDYCLSKENCKECAFSEPNACKIADRLGSEWSPSGFELEELENSIKPKVVIYKVEHSKGGKRYTFISDETLPIGSMVCCDTKYGQTYGKIVSWDMGIDNGNKKCWRINQWQI
jgi:hypothetical protein